jgi:hypothetical protein
MGGVQRHVGTPLPELCRKRHSQNDETAMRYEQKGTSIWWGTPDAPAPEGNIAASTAGPLTEASLIFGVHPTGSRNAVEVRYCRVHGVAHNLFHALLARTDPRSNTKYFVAPVPEFHVGDTFEYIGVVTWPSGQVPAAAGAGSSKRPMMKRPAIFPLFWDNANMWLVPRELLLGGVQALLSEAIFELLKPRLDYIKSRLGLIVLYKDEPAQNPDAQAHWKLNPPNWPVTSTTSPMKYSPGALWLSRVLAESSCLSGKVA